MKRLLLKRLLILLGVTLYALSYGQQVRAQVIDQYGRILPPKDAFARKRLVSLADAFEDIRIVKLGSYNINTIVWKDNSSADTHIINFFTDNDGNCFYFERWSQGNKIAIFKNLSSFGLVKESYQGADFKGEDNVNPHDFIIFRRIINAQQLTYFQLSNPGSMYQRKVEDMFKLLDFIGKCNLTNNQVISLGFSLGGIKKTRSHELDTQWIWINLHDLATTA